MTANEVNIEEGTSMKHDLLTLKEYIKDDLYYGVKFIYRPVDDLAVDGDIYKHYFKKCKPKMGNGESRQSLMTLGRATGSRESITRLHLQNVWNTALASKLQIRCLAQKRSAVYTVMQNKFADLCGVCVEHKCVMISLEGMLERLKQPKHYYVFYDHFYRAAVGEIKWREFARRKKGRICNSNTEAFALLLLTNKYMPWLAEAKEKHGEKLMTEYEELPSTSKNSISDHLLKDLEFDIDVIQKGISRRDPTAENQDENQEDIDEDEQPAVLLQTKSSYGYKKAKAERVKWCKALQAKPSTKQMIEDVSKGERSLNEFSGNEHAKKRRKMMKGLSPFTGDSNGVAKLKGWTSEGHQVFQDYNDMIKEDEDSGKIEVWERAYRELFAILESSNSQKKKHGELEEKKRMIPDISRVWQLSEI